MRYCSLKNPAFWLVLRFFYHNSKTRFLPNISLLQKVERSFALSCWRKNAYMNGIFFPQKLKNVLFRTFSAIFIHFRDFLSPQSPSEVFLQNLTFLNLQYLTSWKKIRKSCWSGDLALQTERQTKPNLQDTSTRVGTHLVFGLHSNYILTAAEWWYIPVRFGWKYLYQKAWYK